VVNLYGIFAQVNGKAHWTMVRNKRQALSHARRWKAYVVRVTDDPSIGAWDAPTFKALGDVIADYRRGVVRAEGVRVRGGQPFDLWFPSRRACNSCLRVLEQFADVTIHAIHV
jgi:hypothetical protein